MPTMREHAEASEGVPIPPGMEVVVEFIESNGVASQIWRVDRSTNVEDFVAEVGSFAASFVSEGTRGEIRWTDAQSPTATAS